jgi:hypothetical protein
MRFIGECKDTFYLKPDYSVSTATTLQYRSSGDSYFITIPLTLAHYLQLDDKIWLKPLNYFPDKGLLIKVERSMPFKKRYDEVYVYSALSKWKTREKREMFAEIRNRRLEKEIAIYEKYSKK